MLDNPYFGKLLFPRPPCGWGHCSGPGCLALHFLPSPHLDNPCLCVQSGLEVTGPFPAQNSSAPSIPWHLLQTHIRGLGGPPAGLTTPHPSTLTGPDLWKQAGSGIPGLPAPAEWHSAMRPGHQRPNVTLPLAVLVSDQDKRPPLFWSSGFPGGHRGNTTTGSAGRSGKRSGASWLWDNRHWVSLSSCPFPSPSHDSGFKSLLAPWGDHRTGPLSKSCAVQFRTTWNHSTECCHRRRGSGSGICRH